MRYPEKSRLDGRHLSESESVMSLSVPQNGMRGATEPVIELFVKVGGSLPSEGPVSAVECVGEGC